MNITLRPRRVLRFLLIIIATLTVLNAYVVVSKHVFGHGNLYGLVRLFDVDGESNVPAYFSALQLAVAALVLFAIAMNRRATGDRFGVHWLVLAAIFAFLSVDEAAMIHEATIGKLLRAHFVLTGIWRHAWYIVYGFLLIGLIAVYSRFLWQLPRVVLLRFTCAGAVFLAGAVGLELVGSYLWSISEAEPAVNAFRMAVVAAVEECLEMLGIALFVYVALDYAANCGATARIEVCADAGAHLKTRRTIWPVGRAVSTQSGPSG